MTDFIKFCPKCRTLFRDSDLYHRHLATCGAVQAPEAESVPEPKETAVRRRQTAAERRDGKPQTADSNREDIKNPLASAAVCNLPSAVSTHPPKFKT